MLPDIWFKLFLKGDSFQRVKISDSGGVGQLRTNPGSMMD